MDPIDIKSLLRKRDLSKIDTFLPRSHPKKQSQTDLLNLLQTWTHSLLHHKNLYPHDAFAQRQILGIPVLIASAKPLSTFLDEFFVSLKGIVDMLNHLTVAILSEEGE